MYFLILSTKLMLLKLSHCESAMSKLKNSTAHLMDPGAAVRGILCAQVPILLSFLIYVVIVQFHDVCTQFKTLQLHKFYLRNTNFIIILNICCQSCQYDWTNFEAQMGSMRVKVDFLTPFPNATQCLNVYTTPNYQFHIYSLNMLSLLLSHKSRNP